MEPSQPTLFINKQFLSSPHRTLSASPAPQPIPHHHHNHHHRQPTTIFINLEANHLYFLSVWSRPPACRPAGRPFFQVLSFRLIFTLYIYLILLFLDLKEKRKEKKKKKKIRIRRQEEDKSQSVWKIKLLGKFVCGLFLYKDNQPFTLRVCVLLVVVTVYGTKEELSRSSVVVGTTDTRSDLDFKGISSHLHPPLLSSLLLFSHWSLSLLLRFLLVTRVAVHRCCLLFLVGVSYRSSSSFSSWFPWKLNSLWFPLSSRLHPRPWPLAAIFVSSLFLFLSFQLSSHSLSLSQINRQ